MNASSKVITIGKRLVPASQIAFVKPFDPAANPEFKPEKDFKSRIVLRDKDIVLAEQTVQAFAEELGAVVPIRLPARLPFRYRIGWFGREGTIYTSAIKPTKSEGLSLGPTAPTSN